MNEIGSGVTLFTFSVFENLEIKQYFRIWRTWCPYLWTTSNSSPQLLQPPPSIVLYINKRELELMKKFREQLEDKTRMLQDSIKNLQDTLEMMTEQFRRMQDSSFQVRGQFHVSKRPKGEEKGTLIVLRSLKGLLVVTAAAPVWHGTFGVVLSSDIWIFSLSLGCSGWDGPSWALAVADKAHTQPWLLWACLKALSLHALRKGVTPE